MKVFLVIMWNLVHQGPTIPRRTSNGGWWPQLQYDVEYGNTIWVLTSFLWSGDHPMCLPCSYRLIRSSVARDSYDDLVVPESYLCLVSKLLY